MSQIGKALPPSTRLRVIVAGLVGQYPVGGVAWDYLQYVIGLSRLGHDVYYYEDTWSWPYNPVERTYSPAPSYSTAFIDRFFELYAPGLRARWHYRHLHELGLGMPTERFDEVARTADLFINVSGANMFPDHLAPACLKLFLDTDPGYNQIVLQERPSWSENVDRWAGQVSAHDRFATYAENIASPDCLVPTLGIDWLTTRMPVVCDLWQDAGARAPDNAWSTVLTWNAFKGALLLDGVEYRSKDAEMERIIDLPSRSAADITLALGGMDAPADRLREHGWRVIDGPAATITPEQYQSLIRTSKAEISPAKHVYAALRTGWFSCRSACYLATGRPVVVQDTGFGAILPTGEGILSFSDLDGAVAGIRAVEADYKRHSRAAREVAEAYFDSDKVLGEMLDAAFSKELPVAEGAH